jgi:hypothetical protein
VNLESNMSERDDQLLSRFIDGELDREESRALRERLISDPELRARLDRMRAVNARVKAAFDVPGAERVPPAIEALVRGNPAGDRKRHSWAMAMAASLVAAAGLLLVTQWQEQTQQPDGVPAADARLARVLENAASRAEGWEALQDGRRIRPVLSFANLDGEWCREFLLAQDRESFRGVACRHQGEWRTEILAAAEVPATGGDYRPAGAAESTAVASYVYTHAAGIPLSLEQEAELIARQWR